MRIAATPIFDQLVRDFSYAARQETIAQRGLTEARALGAKAAPTHIDRFTPRLGAGEPFGPTASDWAEGIVR
jgi:hypothetical protein